MTDGNLNRAHTNSEILNPIDVYAEAELEKKKRNASPKKEELQRPKTCIKIGTHKRIETFKKTSTLCMNLEDEDIMARYKEMNSNMKSRPYTAAIASSRIKQSKDFAEAQPKAFDAYTASQRRWSSFLNGVCKELNRKPYESVVIRAKEYRERIERANALQLKSPSPFINGTQSWCLSLRNSTKSKEIKHYDIPFGNIHTGLWIRVTENPAKQEPIIRVPNSPQGKFRLYKRRRDPDEPGVQQEIEKELNKNLNELIVRS